MMWGKECGIVGHSFYYFPEINTKLCSKKDTEQFISSHPKKVDMDSVYKFIYYLKFKFYCDCSMIKSNKNLYENTCDKVIINDFNIHIDSRLKIVIFTDMNVVAGEFNERATRSEGVVESAMSPSRKSSIQRGSKLALPNIEKIPPTWGSITRFIKLINILKCKYDVHIVCKKTNDFSYYSDEINNICPDFLIVEYVKLHPILQYIKKNITTFVDIHDIISDRSDTFKKYDIKCWNSLTLTEELILLKKFDYIITIQKNEESKLKKYLPEKNIFSVPHIQFNKSLLLKELKNIFLW